MRCSFGSTFLRFSSCCSTSLFALSISCCTSELGASLDLSSRLLEETLSLELLRDFLLERLLSFLPFFLSFFFRLRSLELLSLLSRAGLADELSDFDLDFSSAALGGLPAIAREPAWGDSRFGAGAMGGRGIGDQPIPGACGGGVKDVNATGGEEKTPLATPLLPPPGSGVYPLL